MSSNIFFVGKNIKTVVTIDEDIKGIKEVIGFYQCQSEDFRDRMSSVAYMDPDMALSFVHMITVLDTGIDAHLSRLATLKKIRRNEMVAASELNLLTIMPVFSKYEEYDKVDLDEESEIFQFD